MSSIIVASAKGGVGKSTFCAGVGNMLAINGKKTLLVDMDIGVRSLDLLLGVAEKTVYNWGDIVRGNCDRKTAVINIRKNLSLLAAPMAYEDYSAEKFSEIMRQFGKEYDFVIFDSPAGLESGFKLAAANAEMCIIAATPDKISIRAASAAAQSARKCGIDELRLVINRFDKKTHGKINADDIIDTVGARLLGIIPESAEIGGTVNGHTLKYNSSGALAFLRISERLCGEDVPLVIKNL